MARAKKLFAVVMIKFIVLGVCWQFIAITYFYLNQEEITEKYCVNKDEPQKNCHGKCHLDKVLNLENESINNDALTYSSSVILIFQSFDQLSTYTFLIDTKLPKTNSPYLFSVKTHYINKISHPPEAV
jgi:hypothetical protein